MRNVWMEISYRQFPSFNNKLERYNYELEREEMEEMEETEDDECLGLRSRYMFTL